MQKSNMLSKSSKSNLYRSHRIWNIGENLPFYTKKGLIHIVSDLCIQYGAGEGNRTPISCLASTCNNHYTTPTSSCFFMIANILKVVKPRSVFFAIFLIKKEMSHGLGSDPIQFRFYNTSSTGKTIV